MQVTNRVVDLVQEGVDVAQRVRANLDDSGSLVIKDLGWHQLCWLRARNCCNVLASLSRPKICTTCRR